MKNLVVGVGLTGAVIAERLASKLGESVTVIEKESHLGGIYYDYFDGETGNLVHANHYNVLHTNIKYVWDYLNQFGEMKPFYFRPKAEIQGRPVSIPLCLTSLYEIFPNDFAKSFESKLISKYGYNNRITISDIHKNYDEDLKFLAEYFYENLFKPYTIKRWGVKEENIPPCSETLYPFFTGIDTRYYKDKYQAVPEDGWTGRQGPRISGKRCRQAHPRQIPQHLPSLDGECTRLVYLPPALVGPADSRILSS